MKKALMPILFIAITANALADDFYQCLIKSELHVNDNGVLVNYKKPINLQKTFSINKATGIINSYPLSNLTSRKTEVITSGGGLKPIEIFSASDENGLSLSQLIYVESFNKSLEKPFTAISGSEIYSGTCLLNK